MFSQANPSVKADAHEGFCSRSMLQAHFARVSTHEGGFSTSSLNLPRELAPKIFNLLNIVEHFAGWKFCSRGLSIPLKSLVHTEELCSRSVPLGHAPRAKSLVCIGLNSKHFVCISGEFGHGDGSCGALGLISCRNNTPSWVSRIQTLNTRLKRDRT